MTNRRRPPAPRTLAGWTVTGAIRGSVAGLLYPSVVCLVLLILAIWRVVSPPELPPGTMESETSLAGVVTLIGYGAMVALFAGVVGAVVGAMVGAVVGLVCGSVDSLTRRRFDPIAVACTGVALYAAAAVVVIGDPLAPLWDVLIVVGPGLLALATHVVVPLGLRRPVPSLDMTSVTIRPARAEDGERLRDIERAAGERFREVDLVAIAEDEPMSAEELAVYADGGRSFVAEIERDGAPTPVGYVLVDVIDGNAHIEQVSVHPSAQGRGVGRALVDRVVEHAREHGQPAITLTTFADVAWNAPLYAHLGFRTLTADELGPELCNLVETEAAHGLDPDQRVCMRREVRSSHADPVKD